MKSLGLGKAFKAVYAGVGATLTGLGVALVDAHTFQNVSDASWITIAALALASAGAVYGVTNSNTASGPTKA